MQLFTQTKMDQARFVIKWSYSEKLNRNKAREKMVQHCQMQKLVSSHLHVMQACEQVRIESGDIPLRGILNVTKY